MMKKSAATTLSGAVVALSFVAVPAHAESSAVPTPTLHGLSHTVTSHGKRIDDLEKQLGELRARNSGFQQTSYSPQSGNAPRSYIIQAGDTVSEIARKHNVERRDLMRANNLEEGQQIYIGDELIIPAMGVSKPSPAPNFAGGSDKPMPKKPQQTKPAPSPAPKPAPTPKPAPSPSPAASGGAQFITYTVRQGDSLSKIARKNKISVDEIVRANNLRNANHISINQALKIPVAGATAPSKPAPQSSSKPDYAGTTPEANSEDFGVYTVQKGDTLWSLARDFFTTQQEIQQLNEMGRSTILKPGQELIVPTKKYFEYHNRLSEAS